jgi:uncharacterized protein DUF1579
MSSLTYAAAAASLLVILGGVQLEAQETDPSKTTYGDRSPNSPRELGVFAFLVGKWQGTGKARLPDGKVAEFGGLSWIGRYVLDGTAIAVEMHAAYPDGRPGLGFTFLQYDATRKAWIVEFLNVSDAFLRKQVNGSSGAVHVDGRTVTVVSEGPTKIREHYLVVDQNNFVYHMDLSTDGGRSWDEGQVEMTFHRLE